MATTVETTTPQEISLEKTHLHLAQENGRFYGALLDVLISRSEDLPTKQQKIRTLRDDLPPHLRALYQKGAEGLVEELNYNHSLIGRVKGQEVAFLVSDILESEKDVNKRIEIMRQIKSSNPVFVEPSPGIFVLVLDEPGFKASHNILSGYDQGYNGGENIDGFARTRSDHDKPTYIVMPRNPGWGRPEQVTMGILRHETHHVLWSFLKRKGFIRKPQEKTPELATAFANVRNEFAAYLISSGPLVKDNQFLLSYSQDQEAMVATIDANNFIAVCCELARQNKFDRLTFLYAVMKSRDFAELKANLAELTPVVSDPSQPPVDVLFNTWATGTGVSPRRNWAQPIQDLLALKKITITWEQVAVFCRTKIEEKKGKQPHKKWTDQSVLTEIFQAKYGDISTIEQFIVALGYQLTYNDSFPEGKRIRLGKIPPKSSP